MGRIGWIDATKGYAISLVVFGHVLGGAMARDWLSQADSPRLIYDYIYSFHMPLFFLLSGALGISGVRANPGRAMLSRVGSIAWPYFLWGIIAMFVYPLVSQFRLNAPHDDFAFYEAFKSLLLGQSSWFLWTLFVVQCIVIAALQIMPIELIFGLSVVVFLALATKDLGMLSTVIRFTPFLALGAMLGHKIDVIKCGSNAGSLAFGGLLFIILFVVVFLGINEIPIFSLCCGIVGSSATLLLARSLESTWLNVLLAKCGIASLIIFLLHPYFQGAARELVLWAKGPSLWWQLTIPTVAGVVGPTLIWFGAEYLGLQWLFRLDLTWLDYRPKVGRRSAG